MQFSAKFSWAEPELNRRHMDFQSISQNTQGDTPPQVAPTPVETLSPGLPLNKKNDADLRAILTAWPTLSKAIRRSLAAMATASIETMKRTK